jgi:hypothetical protein
MNTGLTSKKSFIISYIVPVAVDDLGSRRPAEKTKGDGQTNSCDRVARNSKKNIWNEYARHGGMQLNRLCRFECYI